MPTTTPSLGLKKPLGNEVFNRQAYNENLDLMDQNAAKKMDLNAHLVETMPHKFVNGAKTYRWGLKVVNGVVTMQYEEEV